MKSPKTKIVDTNELAPLIFGTIRLIHLHLNKQHRQELTFFSPLQLQTLGYVKNHENPLMKDLASYLTITPPSATSLVDCLVKDKMLTRHLSPQDRRLIHLHLTPKGLKFFNHGVGQMNRHLKEIYTCLTKREQKQMLIIYKKIRNYFKQL